MLLAALVLAGLPLQAAAAEPDKVVVQHILIGFGKAIPGRKLDRTKKQARALAEDLFRRVQEGEDFDALVKEYTDDQYPGIMLLTNKDAPRVAGGSMRSQVVAKFGDLAFRLEVGEIGLVTYHAAASPYGWHVMKRLE
jgi:parvulin-like peptidyl-prolyl isomerase